MSCPEDQLFLRYRDRGDVEALTEVFDRSAPKLLLLAMHMVRDATLAEDLVQATFLVAIQDAASYRPGTPLLRWLARILSNRAKAERRAARRRGDVPEHLGRVSGAPAANPDDDPLHAVTGQETVEQVTRAVEELAEPYRSVIVLRLVHGLQPTEIGHTLGRAPGTVRMQLQRGLQILRSRLPKSLVVPAALLATPEVGLAAVRAKVVAAAASAAGTAATVGVGGTGVIAGVVLMKKVLLAGAAAAVVAGAAWFAWPDDVVSLPTDDGGVTESSVVADRSHGSTTTAASERSQLLNTEDPTKPKQAVEPTAAARYDVRILVVDAKGDPVANANVCLFEPAHSNKRGQSVFAWTRATVPPFHTDLTDTAGRCVLQVEREAFFLEASKDGIGTTGDLRVRKGMRELRSEWRLILQSPVRIAGVVLEADGAPAVSAKVRCWFGGLPKWRNLSPPPPTTTDRRGRFAFRVIPGACYRMRANLGKRHSRSAEADLVGRKPRDHEITLQFAGAYSIRGLLLDGGGKPIAGSRVDVRPVPPGKGVRESRWGGRATTSADGRFEVLLTDGGRYYVAGGAKGWTADCRQVELDKARPHQEVTLRLKPYAVVSGRIVDERGKPCAGVFLGLSWTAKQSKRRQLISNLNGSLPRGLSAADGSFRFMAPAGLRYRIGCRPLADKPRFYVLKQEVSPPVEGVVVVLTKADRKGLTISGSVVEAATGAPVPAFTVSRVESSRPGNSSMGTLARCKDAKGQFQIGPILARYRYWLVVEAPGFAEARLGPFDPKVARQKVRFEMQKPGTVRCTVRRHDGTIMAKAYVWLKRDGGHAFGPFHSAVTDAHGVAVLKRVVPDRYKVSAQRQGDEDPGRVGKDIEVRPGQETRVTLTLRK